MSSADLFEDGFPHGTKQGWDRGCRGAACPASLEHGLSCRRAFELSAGDYRYTRLVANGLTPAEIAAQLHEAPHPHPAPAPARITTQDEEDDEDEDTDIDLEEVTTEEEPAMPAPKPAPPTRTLTPLKAPRKSPAGPSQAEVREWAHANGVDVNARGAVRRDVVEKYLAAQAGYARPASPIEADDVPIEAVDVPIEADDVLPDMSTWRDARTTIRTDIAEQLAQLNAHIDHLRDERDEARHALTLVLAKWAREQRNAHTAHLDLDASRGASRLLMEALEQAEEELVASRGLAAARLEQINRLEAQLDANASRAWWKRGAA